MTFAMGGVPHAGPQQSTVGDVDFSGIGKQIALTPLGAEMCPSKGSGEVPEMFY